MSVPWNRRRISPAPNAAASIFCWRSAAAAMRRCTVRCSTRRRRPSMKRARDVESALRQAVRSAHQVLRQANEGLPEAQWRGGASLVVRYADRADDRTIRAGADPDQPPQNRGPVPGRVGRLGTGARWRRAPRDPYLRRHPRVGQHDPAGTERLAAPCRSSVVGGSGGRPQCHACQPIPGTIGRQRGAERPARQLQQHHPGVARRRRTAARCRVCGQRRKSSANRRQDRHLLGRGQTPLRRPQHG